MQPRRMSWHVTTRIDAEQVVVYHLLTEGRASVRLDDGSRLSLEAGDIVMIPHGDRHIVENGLRPARWTTANIWPTSFPRA